MKTENNTQALDRILDLLVDDIFSATDEEILQEAREDYSDPDVVVDFVRDVVGKARLAVARDKLHKIKSTASCGSFPGVGLVDSLDENEVKRIFDNISSQDDGAMLSLAARGRSELTVKEIKDILKELEQCGCDLSQFAVGAKE